MPLKLGLGLGQKIVFYQSVPPNLDHYLEQSATKERSRIFKLLPTPVRTFLIPFFLQFMDTMKGVWMKMVCTITWSHADVHRPCWCQWSMLQPVVHAAAKDRVDVCALCWDWRPCGCCGLCCDQGPCWGPWSVPPVTKGTDTYFAVVSMTVDS